MFLPTTSNEFLFAAMEFIHVVFHPQFTLYDYFMYIRILVYLSYYAYRIFLTFLEATWSVVVRLLLIDKLCFPQVKFVCGKIVFVS